MILSCESNFRYVSISEAFIFNISCSDWSFIYENLDSEVALDFISRDFISRIFSSKFLTSSFKCYRSANNYLASALVSSNISYPFLISLVRRYTSPMSWMLVSSDFLNSSVSSYLSPAA